MHNAYLMQRLSGIQQALLAQPTEAVSAEVPETINELIPKLREFVAQVREGRRVLLAMDALNQLDEADNAQAMYWLPREWPAHVKVVLRCANDPERSEQALKAFEHRPHHRVTVGPLTGNQLFNSMQMLVACRVHFGGRK